MSRFRPSLLLSAHRATEISARVSFEVSFLDDEEDTVAKVTKEAENNCPKCWHTRVHVNEVLYSTRRPAGLVICCRFHGVQLSESQKVRL